MTIIYGVRGKIKETDLEQQRHVPTMKCDISVGSLLNDGSAKGLREKGKDVSIGKWIYSYLVAECNGKLVTILLSDLGFDICPVGKEL